MKEKSAIELLVKDAPSAIVAVNAVPVLRAVYAIALKKIIDRVTVLSGS